MEQNAIISYNAPREVNIGDVFYKIKAEDFQAFREPCLVCKDEKELTINGITFKCPCCGNTAEVLRINQYVVQRYRVFNISDEVDNSEWKPGELHKVSFGLYRKVGHGYQWASHSEITMSAEKLSRGLNPPEDEVLKTTYVDPFIFEDYGLAVRMAKALTERELRRLDEYNALHGTKYKAEFKTENDKKSN